MIYVRRSDERGHNNYGWLNTYHTFSFGRYHDPDWMQFRSLRVLNEDRVQPGQGFNTHPHRDMEIITYVIDGELTHEDGMGHKSTLGPGGVQHMSAGTGVTHSEHNASISNPLHFIQIWILPISEGLKPSYSEATFDRGGFRGQLFPVAVGINSDGDQLEFPTEDGTLKINQDAVLYASILDGGEELNYTLPINRHVWIQVIKGEIHVNSTALSAGDAAGLSLEQQIKITCESDNCEFLFFDLK